MVIDGRWNARISCRFFIYNQQSITSPTAVSYRENQPSGNIDNFLSMWKRRRAYCEPSLGETGRSLSVNTWPSEFFSPA